MKKIKMMADYGCFPLWDILEPRNIDPHELNLSSEICYSLELWQKKYDETLNLRNPIESGFRSSHDEFLFKKEGEEIFSRLAKEVGDEYEVFLHL